MVNTIEINVEAKGARNPYRLVSPKSSSQMIYNVVQ
jgi:hypothetical protein